VVLFWAWIGWFPFCVYSTTFIGEVLKRYDTKAQAELAETSDKVGETARIGSKALVAFSCVNLLSSILLPYLVLAPPSDKLHKPAPKRGALAKFSKQIEPYKPELSTVWVWGHIWFSALMFLTLGASTVAFATLLMASSGV
jgi:solute carrier family 45 protein 1/2/4